MDWQDDERPPERVEAGVEVDAAPRPGQPPVRRPVCSPGRPTTRYLVRMLARPQVRALAYLVVILLVSSLLGFFWGEGLGLESPGQGKPPTLLELLIADLLIVSGQLAVTHLFLRRVDRCGWRDLLAGPLPPRGEGLGVGAPPGTGLEERGRRGVDLAHLGLGCALGAGSLGLLLAAGSLAGWMRWTGWGPAAAAGWPWAVQVTMIALAASLLQGGGEEVIFRGYVLRNLSRWRGLVVAAAGSAVLFAIVHGLNPGAGPLAVLGIAVIGVFLALLRARLSVWAAIGFHALWNAGLMLLSLPCSGMVFGGLASVEATGPRLWTGGDFGVEASLLTAVVFGAGALALSARRVDGRPRRVDGHPRRATAHAPSGSAPDPPRTT